jgi:hypothetical protein
MSTEVSDSILVDTPSAAALPTSPTPASPARRTPRRATVQGVDDHDHRHDHHNDRPVEEAPPVVVDDPNSRSYPPLPPDQPIVEPHHPEFTPSENAKNRYAVEDVYEFGDQVRNNDVVRRCIYIVYISSSSRSMSAYKHAYFRGIVIAVA